MGDRYFDEEWGNNEAELHEAMLRLAEFAVELMEREYPSPEGQPGTGIGALQAKRAWLAGEITAAELRAAEAAARKTAYRTRLRLVDHAASAAACAASGDTGSALLAKAEDCAWKTRDAILAAGATKVPSVSQTTWREHLEIEDRHGSVSGPTRGAPERVARSMVERLIRGEL